MFHKKKQVANNKNGDNMANLFMKEKIIFFLVILIFTFLIFTKQENEKTIPVFSEDNYNTYIVDFKDDYITSKDLTNFQTIDAIYPYVDSKYSFDSHWYYIDKTISLDQNIKILIDKYKKIYDYNAFYNESVNIDINGIRIKKIRITTNNINKYNMYDITKYN